MNPDALATLRGIRDQQEEKTSLRAWSAPTRADIGYGRVLAFDPSLSACAVVVLISDATGITIRDAQVMKLPPIDAKRSRESSLRRGLHLVDTITNWYACSVPDDNWSVVYEAVPEGGGIRAPEATLLGTMAILMAARTFRGRTLLRPPVPAQAHKRFICGNRNATKAEHHGALIPLAHALGVRGVELLTNEDKRDAFSVGLYSLACTHG